MKRLWLTTKRRELATPPDAATRARLRMGHEIGGLARERWPSGVLVTEAAARHAAAARRTRQLLEDVAVAAVFEGAFEFEQVRIRADALVRAGASFELVEVKSSSRLKPEHISDVAIQLYVLEGCGLDITRASLMHLNTEYEWQGGRYDLERLFTIEDVSEQARAELSQVHATLPLMRAALGGENAPEVPVGRHCTRPYRCQFKEHCWRSAPVHHVIELPRAGAELLARLAADGIDDVRDMRAGVYQLSATQEAVRKAVVSGEAHVDRKRLHRDLAEIETPTTFLDFETFAPALPVYVGTRPHEVIPFQWSAHIDGGDGHVDHREFLWTGDGDPRPHFIAALLAALPPRGSIVVYSPYEGARLRALADVFAPAGGTLLRFFEERVIDLHRVIRDSVYHPAFHGSFSLKRVLPVLVPDLSYDELAIGDGMEAATAYAELLDAHTASPRRRAIERSLREYCRLDTEAELRLLAALRAL